MTRHPSARRVHRQGTSDDDAFVAGVLETTAWAKQHQRTLIIAGILAAVLLTALVLFTRNRIERRNEAAAQLSQVRAVALSGNAPLAIRELEQYLSRFDGTPSAGEARLLLGRAYLQAEQPQEAIDAVRRLGDDLDSNTGGNAALLLAAAHEEAGNTQAALDAYMRVGRDAGFLYLRQEALENAARLRLQENDGSGAAEIYRQLLEITPANAPERAVFELRLGEALALAATGGTAAAAQQGTAPAPAAQPDTTGTTGS